MQKLSTVIKKKLILGVTGTFGSGKSTVARILARTLGAKIIDADRIAHRLIRPGGKVYKRIVAVFAQDILGKNKIINRKLLAKKVFSRKALVAKLNKITHPALIKEIKKQIRQAAPGEIIIIDAPLLIEAGLGSWVDKIIVIKISSRQQQRRLNKKLSLNKAELLKRLKFQMSFKNKVRLADFVIDNNGTIKATKKQIQELRRKLWIN